MHRMHVSFLSHVGGPYMCGVYLHVPCEIHLRVKGRKHVFDAW